MREEICIFHFYEEFPNRLFSFHLFFFHPVQCTRHVCIHIHTISSNFAGFVNVYCKYLSSSKMCSLVFHFHYGWQKFYTRCEKWPFFHTTGTEPQLNVISLFPSFLSFHSSICLSSSL